MQVQWPEGLGIWLIRPNLKHHKLTITKKVDVTLLGPLSHLFEMNETSNTPLDFDVPLKELSYA